MINSLIWRFPAKYTFFALAFPALCILHSPLATRAVRFPPMIANADAQCHDPQQRAGVRLPQALHGFTLGMSVEEARKTATKLGYTCKWKPRTWQTEKAPCAEAKLHDVLVRPAITLHSAALSVEVPEGFNVELVFVKDSLIYITSELDKISVRDARAFGRTTASKLGEPVVKFMVSQRVHVWRSIWIDGPVRIAYEEGPDPASGDNGMHRLVSLEVVSYSQWFEVFASAVRQDPTIPYGPESTDAILDARRKIWGGIQPGASRLPRELAGLRLGATVSEALRVRPDVKMPTGDIGNAHDVTAEITGSTVATVHNGELVEICEDKRIPFNQLEGYRNKLPTEYGDPQYADRNQQNQVVGLSWWHDYEGLAMRVGFLRDESVPRQSLDASPSPNVVVRTCIEDVGLATKPFVEGSINNRVPFRRSPPRRSFF